MLSFKDFLEENEHLKHYTTAGRGFELNRKLASGESLTPEEHSHVEGLKAHIMNNRITKSTTLYRGVGEKPGKSVYSRGFLSTSNDLDTALQYAENHRSINGSDSSHVLQIHARPGNPVADIDEHSMYQGEGEHLIHPDTRIHITHSEYDPETRTHIHHGSIAE